LNVQNANYRPGYTQMSTRPWEDHGGITVRLSSSPFFTSTKRDIWANGTDNLVVQWGLQDNYEIVRKVGRGKYSEVSPLFALATALALALE